MIATIETEALNALVEKAVAEVYCGDAFELNGVELVVNSPRGKPRYVTAKVDMVPVQARQAPALSAVSEG